MPFGTRQPKGTEGGNRARPPADVLAARRTNGRRENLRVPHIPKRIPWELIRLSAKMFPAFKSEIVIELKDGTKSRIRVRTPPSKDAVEIVGPSPELIRAIRRSLGMSDVTAS